MFAHYTFQMVLAIAADEFFSMVGAIADTVQGARMGATSDARARSCNSSCCRKDRVTTAFLFPDIAPMLVGQINLPVLKRTADDQTSIVPARRLRHSASDAARLDRVVIELTLAVLQYNRLFTACAKVSDAGCVRRRAQRRANARCTMALR